MSGIVYVREWQEDPTTTWVAIIVRHASNGVLEVACETQDGRRRKCQAWWKWKSEGADTLYQYVDELARLPGWKGQESRDLVFDNLEARRHGRVMRWIASKTGEASQGKGSYFPRRVPSSRP